MKTPTRRNFLSQLAMASASTMLIPGFPTLVNAAERPGRFRAENGMVILFQGDSITDGNRGRTTDPNHIMGHGYAFSIASRLGADHPEKGLIFYNRGISGNKVNDLAKRWQTDTLDLKPDLLSILVGVNDTASVVFNREPVISAEKYEELYQSLLDQTLEKFPEIVLVLCEPFILPVGKVKDNLETYKAEIVKRQAIVRKLAEKYKTVFVGFQEVFDNACNKAADHYWMWDGVHPTVAGHELMAREWLKQVGKRVSFRI